MQKVLLRLYLAWSLVVFTIVMVTLLPFLLLPFLLGMRIGSPISYFFMRLWAIHFSFPNLGIWFRVHGREKISPNETYIFCANHNSFMDTPAVVWAIKNPLKPLGKIEMTKVPIFGFIYKYVTIMVDRNSPESRRKSMIEMGKQLSHGVSVLVFPEGAMNQTTELMQPFHKGAFRIAVDAQRPVVPVVVINSKHILPPIGGLHIRPGIIDVYILDPIDTEGMKPAQVEGLMNETHAKMLAVMEAKTLSK